jgi:hypothetical protein
MALTNRMTNWISTLGVHIATSNKNGYPRIIVADTVEVKDEYIIAPLTDTQAEFIKNNIAENPQVAIAPGQIGSIRAPYQFKGKASINNNQLKILIDEIYCTKPGYEAGLRLDTIGFEGMKKFDENRWTDLASVNK